VAQLVSVIDSNPNGEARWRVGQVMGVEDTGPFPGRHASRTEIAAETPIFHALTVGGWRSRRHEPEAPVPAEQPVPQAPPADPVAEFRRDPLTAPIPIQAYVAPPAPPNLSVVRQTRRTPPVVCASGPSAAQGAHARHERPASGRHAQFVPTQQNGHRLP
jgi:hypothetical protein